MILGFAAPYYVLTPSTPSSNTQLSNLITNPRANNCVVREGLIHRVEGCSGIAVTHPDGNNIEIVVRMSTIEHRVSSWYFGWIIQPNYKN